MIYLVNKRDFKKKQELILLNSNTINKFAEMTITEAKELYNALGTRIMYAESNELISTFLRSNGMDEAQIETGIQQINKLREKL